MRQPTLMAATATAISGDLPSASWNSRTMPSDALLAASGSGRHGQQIYLLVLHTRETACGKMMALQYTVSYSKQQQAGRGNFGLVWLLEEGLVGCSRQQQAAASGASGNVDKQELFTRLEAEALLMGCRRQQQAR